LNEEKIFGPPGRFSLREAQGKEVELSERRVAAEN
jgi:hypothetical protein